MAVLGLGYIGIGASDLAAWRSFASEVLGASVSDGPDGGLRLRLDSRDWRIAIEADASDDIVYAGWEVAGPDALAATAKRIEAAGTVVTYDDGTLARKRGVLGLASFIDPAGVRGELFWGATERFETPFASPAGVSGFVTGEQGLGHIVVHTADLAATGAFYCDVLGFRLSDIIEISVGPNMKLPINFLHCNTRHHSFAFLPKMPGGTARLAHFMLQTASLDDVGFALDRSNRHGCELALELGRHGNDHMVSFYVHSPSGFEIEYGWGARTIDDATWMPVRHDRTSMWGHKYVGHGRPPV